MPGNRQMETHIGPGGEIRIIAERGVKTAPDPLLIRWGGAYRRIPCRTGLYGVACFQNIETVIRIVWPQRFQWLNNILF